MKLLNYIRGLRKGKEAHRLEKEAMQDPFLADAMDGYGSIGESQEKQIELLRKRVTVRATRKKNDAMKWSAAACLLIGLCIGTYFLVQEDRLPENTLVAFEQTVPMVPGPELAIPKPTIPEPAVPSADKSATPAVTEPTVPPAAKPAVPSVIDTKSGLMAATTVTKEVVIVNYLPVKATSDSVQDTREVHGKVTDKYGDPLVGASIAVKGTSLTTLSDLDGKFKLTMDGGKELVVNYIGYEPMTFSADSGKKLLIAMNENRQMLEEVVVVGYGAQRKKNITGATSVLRTTGKAQPIAGWKPFRKYLKDSLRRPTNIECTQVKGKVTLTFRINSKGRPESIIVKKSLCPLADEEAARLIKEGPDWAVGSKPVTVGIKF